MDYSWSPRHSRFFATHFQESFLVLGSFAVQFGDHLWYWDHLRAGIICGAVHISILDKIDSSSTFKVTSFSFKVVLTRVILSFALLDPSYSVKTSSTLVRTFFACTRCPSRIFLFFCQFSRQFLHKSGSVGPLVTFFYQLL